MHYTFMFALFGYVIFDFVRVRSLVSRYFYLYLCL